MLVDCFLFNGEPIVQFRLKIMAPHVDRIYITEARYTYSGVKKELLYIEKCKNWFTPYASKIQFLIVELFDPMTREDEQVLRRIYSHTPQVENWHREHFQRNYAQKHLLELEKQGIEFIAIIADVDEIVNEETLKKIQFDVSNVSNSNSSKNNQSNIWKWLKSNAGVLHLSMDLYYYDWQWKKRSEWTAAFITSHTGIDFSITRNKGHARNSIQLIPSAGWHLSYFMDYDTLIRKIESFSHSENNQARFKSKPWLNSCFCYGTDYLNRGQQEHMDFTHSLHTIMLVNRTHASCFEPGFQYSLYSKDSVAQNLIITRRPCMKDAPRDMVPTLCDQLVEFANGLDVAKQLRRQWVVVDGFISDVCHATSSKCSISMMPATSFLDLDAIVRQLRIAMPFTAGLPFKIMDRHGTNSRNISWRIKDAWYGIPMNFNQIHNTGVVVVKPIVESWVQRKGTDTSQMFLLTSSGMEFHIVFEGDPCPGHVKELVIVFELNETTEATEATETTVSSNFQTPCFIRMNLSDQTQAKRWTLLDLINYRFHSSAAEHFSDRKHESTSGSALYIACIMKSLSFQPEIVSQTLPVYKGIIAILKERNIQFIDLVYDDGSMSKAYQDRTNIQASVDDNCHAVYVIGSSVSKNQHHITKYGQALIPFNAYMLFKEDCIMSFLQECRYEVYEIVIIQQLYQNQLISLDKIKTEQNSSASYNFSNSFDFIVQSILS